MFCEIENCNISERILIAMPPQSQTQSELRYTTQYLSYHKLSQSSKFSGELLLALTSQADIDSNCTIRTFILSNTDNTLQFNKVFVDKQDLVSDAIMLAKVLFEMREFRKAAFKLQEFVKNYENQSAIFIYYYSLFLLGEMQKDDELLEIQD